MKTSHYEEHIMNGKQAVYVNESGHYDPTGKVHLVKQYMCASSNQEASKHLNGQPVRLCTPEELESYVTIQYDDSKINTIQVKDFLKGLN